jgi:Tol biopolymer transport system component
VEALPHEAGPFGELRLSPDQRRVAAVSRDPDHARIVLFDLDRPGGQPLVDLPGYTSNPVWSPDGDWVYFTQEGRDGDADVYRSRSNFSGAAEAVVEGAGDQEPLDVSSDGEWLLFMTDAGGTDDIARVRIEGTEAPEMVVARDGGDDRGGRFSPDGRFVAYTQVSEDPARVYVREIDTGAEYVVSSGFSARPVWARDGSEVFYFAGGDQFAVKIQTEPRVTIGAPETLYFVPTNASPHEPDATAERFLAAVALEVADPGAEGATVRVLVTLNWFEELKERVPTGR